MTALILDTTLAPIELQPHLSKKARSRVLESTFTQGANTRDWRPRTSTITERHFAMGLPEDATMYHQNYLDYLSQTYAAHAKIVLSPDIFWYTALCDIAQHVVANSKQHGAIFTRDPEKKTIIAVPGCETEPLRLDAIYAELVGNVPVDTGMFLPQFTTTTEMARLAMLAAFAEICTPYYDYMMFCCGHPAVKLLGTADDWDTAINRLAELANTFGKVGSELQSHLGKVVLPVAEKIRSALDGNDPDWFKAIFTEEECGSGSQVDIDGWFCRLLMVQPAGSPRQLSNFAPHVTRVPYRTEPSQTRWAMCFGLFYSNQDADGFMVPEFSWVQNIGTSRSHVKHGP